MLQRWAHYDDGDHDKGFDWSDNGRFTHFIEGENRQIMGLFEYTVVMIVSILLLYCSVYFNMAVL